LRKTVLVNFQRLHDTLLSLGYRSIYRENHYRKERFHVIVHPKNGRVELHIHVDKLEPWSPSFRHHSRRTGEDINREYHNIVRALSHVGSRQASEQPKPSLQTS